MRYSVRMGVRVSTLLLVIVMAGCSAGFGDTPGGDTPASTNPITSEQPGADTDDQGSPVTVEVGADPKPGSTDSGSSLDYMDDC